MAAEPLGPSMAPKEGRPHTTKCIPDSAHASRTPFGVRRTGLPAAGVVRDSYLQTLGDQAGATFPRRPFGGNQGHKSGIATARPSGFVNETSGGPI